MAINMISAYYDREADSRGLFEGCKLTEAGTDRSKKPFSLAWDAYLGKFDVIRLVMTKFFQSGVSVDQALSKLQKLTARDIRKRYGDVDYFDLNDLAQTMEDFYAEKGHRFVVVINEWDAIFKNDKEGQKRYLDFLRDWLKDKDYIALAYMTGILPIKKYGKHSALNMFWEYSMTQPMQLAEYVGFTEEEVERLCERYQMSYKEVSDWYDGCLLDDSIPVEDRELAGRGRYEGNRFRIYSPPFRCEGYDNLLWQGRYPDHAYTFGLSGL